MTAAVSYRCAQGWHAYCDLYVWRATKVWERPVQVGECACPCHLEEEI